MEGNFPEISFAVVAIEDDDDLNDFAKLLPPRAYVFAEKKSFLRGGHSYGASDLLSRLISRFPNSQGVLIAGENPFEKGVHYCIENKSNKGEKLGMIDIKSLLRLVFG
jgi:hypothetical protein